MKEKGEGEDEIVFEEPFFVFRIRQRMAKVEGRGRRRRWRRGERGGIKMIFNFFFFKFWGLIR